MPYKLRYQEGRIFLSCFVSYLIGSVFMSFAGAQPISSSEPAPALEADAVPASSESKPKAKPTKLKGRIEDINKIRLSRPDSSVVNQAVEILPGGAYSNALDGRADSANLRSGTAEDTLRSLVSEGGFKLGSYKRKQPQTDPGELNAWKASMDSQKFEWKSVEYDLPIYSLPGGRGRRFSGSVRYTIPRRFYQLDNWSLQQRSVSAQVSYPNSGGSLFQNQPMAMPNYSIPNYKLPSRFLPPNKPMASPPMEADEEQIVEWDSWYRNVADLLWRTWRSKGSQPGEADLRISVDKSRHIRADVLSVSNLTPAFKESLLTAVRTVDGADTLKFPSQSKRQSVIFQTHFVAGVDVKAGATSRKTSDSEILRKNKRQP